MERNDGEMRIATGAMMHETNTFTHMRTGLGAFTCAEGEEVYGIQRWRGTVLDGIFDTLRSGGAELVPAFFARTLPSGTVKRSAYDYIKSKILSGIEKAGTLDGICLALHGSMAVEGMADPQGDLLAELRKITGPGIPIVCPLDMHATVTRKMIENADAFCAYRTAPHIDEYMTGARAAGLLLTSVKSRKKLTTCMRKLPILIAGEKTETDTSPTKELFENLAEMDNEEGILSASYVLGFPWADSVNNGVAALTVGFFDNLPLLDSAAIRLAAAFDHVKEQFDFTTEAHSPEETIEIALRQGSRPVIISDSGDNPTAGASQDSSIMIKLLMDKNVKGALVTAISDKQSYENCFNTGVGKEACLSLGTLKPGSGEASPLSIPVTVKNIARSGNMDYAVVEHDGIDVVISKDRVEVSEPGYMEELGLNLKDYRVIVVKSGYLSPKYRSIAARNMLALTAGDTCEILEELPYKITPRPIFPLDR